MNATRMRCAAAIAGVVFGGWFVGCGSGGPTLPTHDAGGTVTYRGQPVDGATVVFGPSASGGRAATGVTDAAGRFRLGTFGDGDGAVAGGYTVTVSKVVTTGGMSPEEYEKHYDAIAAGTMKVPPTKTTNELPEAYRQMETSPLKAEVKQGADNRFTLELQD